MAFFDFLNPAASFISRTFGRRRQQPTIQSFQPGPQSTVSRNFTPAPTQSTPFGPARGTPSGGQLFGQTGGVLGAQAPTGGGQAAPTGGGGGGQQGPPQEAIPAEPSVNLEDLNTALDEINNLETETRGLLGGDIGGEFQEAAFGRIGLGEEQAQEGIKTQREKGQRTAREGITEQRRGFSEISKQLLGRFGRSGFGLGVVGDIGARTLGNIANIRTKLQDSMSNLNTISSNFVKEFAQQRSEVEATVAQMKQDAKVQLQAALSQINAQRGLLRSAKNTVINNALSNYRQLVADINARNVAAKQQVDLLERQTNESIRKAQATARRQLDEIETFTLGPGQTRFGPATSFGLSEEPGAAELGAFQGQLPAGFQFGVSGGAGILSAPGKEEEKLKNPFE